MRGSTIEKLIKLIKNRIFGFFAPDGRWEGGDSLKILSRGVGTFSTIGRFILETFIFRLFWHPPFDQNMRNLRDYAIPHTQKYRSLCIKVVCEGGALPPAAFFPEKHAFLLILNKTIKTRDAILSDFLVVSRRDLCSEVQW